MAIRVDNTPANPPPPPPPEPVKHDHQAGTSGDGATPDGQLVDNTALLAEYFASPRQPMTPGGVSTRTLLDEPNAPASSSAGAGGTPGDDGMDTTQPETDGGAVFEAGSGAPSDPTQPRRKFTPLEEPITLAVAPTDEGGLSPELFAELADLFGERESPPDEASQQPQKVPLEGLAARAAAAKPAPLSAEDKAQIEKIATELGGATDADIGNYLRHLTDANDRQGMMMTIQALLGKAEVTDTDRGMVLALLENDSPVPSGVPVGDALVEGLPRALAQIGKVSELPALIKAAGESPLADRMLKSSLTGVVTWPEDLAKGKPLAQVFREQSQYGSYLSGAIQDLGQAIADGKFPDFDSLWNSASAVRSNAPSGAPTGVGVPVRGAGGATTPISRQYDFVAERVLSHPQATPRQEGASTVYELALGGEGGTTFSVEQNPNVGGRFVAGNSNYQGSMMSHAAPSTFAAAKARANTHFQAAMAATDQATFERETSAMYWEMARPVFDERGSAAKAEIIYRALHEAKGYSTPLWRPGVSPDLEVMLRSKEEWLRDYRNLQADAKSWVAEYEAIVSGNRVPVSVDPTQAPFTPLDEPAQSPGQSEPATAATADPVEETITQLTQSDALPEQQRAGERARIVTEALKKSADWSEGARARMVAIALEEREKLQSDAAARNFVAALDTELSQLGVVHGDEFAGWQSKVPKELSNGGVVHRAFSVGGKIFLVAGVAYDVFQVATADDKVGAAVEKAGGWTGAWAGAEAAAAAAAPAAAASGPFAWAVEGGAALVGSIIGYFAGSKASEAVYDAIKVDSR